MSYRRGAVVKGPDVFGSSERRPYMCLTDDTHPFSDEEALYAAVTTTRRSIAVPLANDDFETGSLPRDSYVNPWTVTSYRHADIADTEGRLTDDAVETILEEIAKYLGIGE
jgi:mRNA-degrading endonuclease toxin of MazEF toxin-antitoxin module